MTGRIRALAAGVGVVLALGIPAAGAPGSAAGPAIACAAEGPRAVLVVDTGSEVHRLCVALDGASVSGIHLVELASAQHGLSYSLGFGGQAICQIDGVGPPGGDCFAEYPDFWGYWHGTASGGWTWASAGAASFRVDDGDVEGWSWGSGDSGAAHPAPPATRADSVCPPLAKPNPDDGPPPTAGDGSGGGDGGAGAAEDGGTDQDGAADPPEETSTGEQNSSDEERDDDRESDRSDDRDRPAATPATPTGEPATDEGIRATGTTVPDAGGPSVGVLAAFALAFALLAGGWWRTRRGGGRSP
jgi:hypothetical protein